MPNVPNGSVLKAKYGDATYQDCFSHTLSASDGRGPVTLFFDMLYPAPVWVRALMRMRNFIVGFFGLKTTNTGPTGLEKPEADYKVGDNISFFKITDLSENEVVVTANDSHLNSSFSLYILPTDAAREVVMTSIVETKGRFGDVYMFVIAPFHRLIVSQLLKRLSR